MKSLNWETIHATLTHPSMRNVYLYTLVLYFISGFIGDMDFPRMGNCLELVALGYFIYQLHRVYLIVTPKEFKHQE